MKKKILHFLSTFESTFAYALVVVLTALLFIQIINRYLFQTSFVWIEEIIRISFVWMIYFAVASTARENRHIRVGLIDMFVPPAAVRVINYFADAIVIVFNIVIVWLGILLMQASIRYGDKTPVTDIPMWLIYSVIPFCFALMALRILQFNIGSLRGKHDDPDALEPGEEILNTAQE